MCSFLIVLPVLYTGYFETLLCGLIFFKHFLNKNCFHKNLIIFLLILGFHFIKTAPFNLCLNLTELIAKDVAENLEESKKISEVS